MDLEDRRKLDKALALAEENNAMLKKLRGGQKTAAMMRTIYWVFIIGSALAAFYFIQPYLTAVSGLYSGVAGKGDSAFKLPDAKQLQDLVNQLKQGQ